MRRKGGLPKAFEKRPKGPKTTQEFVKEINERVQPLPPPPSPPKQEERSGFSQLLGRPKSPFTGPGPSTAGRKRYHKRRSTRRRKHH
jgi:hypothetical protein